MEALSDSGAGNKSHEFFVVTDLIPADALTRVRIEVDSDRS